ncbi:NAD(P)H-hydrate dehydratase [Pseudoalteromonas fenneropenaei]|uniref:Bifunctional NAD(P)H-hydrate repair enzyme n=1 Tax=Pseudoalteromonas fenneropenaei TaxID=1737459 RepID=A0ABV7CKT8_9GAMM
MKQYSANLPQKAYTAQQVQENEQQAAELSATTLSHLMQRAGAAVCSYILDYCKLHQLEAASCLILVGKGNNAGDGYIVAELLRQQGLSVTVWALFAPQLLTGDAKNAWLAYQQAGGVITENCPESVFDAAIIVDGVFGSGFKGELPANVQDAFALVNGLSVHRVSIDLPSGVNGTSAAVAEGTFCADTTVTFIALKQGMLTGAARGYVGQLLFAGLGVAKSFSKLLKAPSHYSNAENLLQHKPVRAFDSYKHQLGHVLLIGGNLGMAGAIRLAAEACLRSGAGLVSVATHPANQAVVLQGRYELMVHGVADAKALQPLLEKASVVVIGPGLGQDSWAEQLLGACKDLTVPLICDADALNLLAQQPSCCKPAVITPHLGEAKKLLAGFAANNTTLPEALDRFSMAEVLATQLDTICVLKGPGSLVQSPERRNINRSGCAAMASAGMGDVLSGIIAALVAQQVPLFAAVSLAVYIHGLAAEEAAKDGAIGLLASDLFSHIRRILG